MRILRSSKKPRKFLATTALDEFWDKTQPILFLGNWCTAYFNKSVWENLDAELLSFSMLDKNSDEVTNHLYSIYHKMMPQLAAWLNKIHQTDNTLRYWEILIGSFLFSHIKTTHDRYMRLEHSYQQYPDLETIGLSEDAFYTPLNTNDYYQLVLSSDLFNLQMISRIIYFTFSKNIIFKDASWNADIIDHCQQHQYRLLTKIKINILWIIAKFRGSGAVALLHNDFSKKETLWLMFRSFFKIIPIVKRTCCYENKLSYLRSKINVEIRRELATLSEQDAFIRCIFNQLVIDFPKSFIENYVDECKMSQKNYPCFIKAVVGVPSIGHDGLKIWLAKNIENGTKRIELQHGGGYGILKSLSRAFWDYQHSDFFIAWGMDSSKKIIAAPAITICQQKKIQKKIENNKLVLWITTEFSRYPWCEVKHLLGAPHYENLYYQWQLTVLNLIDPNIFSVMIMRLRHTNFSDSWQLIQKEFPALNIYKPNSRGSFYQQIRTAKLLLIDNLNTTFLFALALNIPCILFWSNCIWTIDEKAACYFDALHSVGIYHSTPESAAQMINRVYDNPFEWWYGDEVQQARKQFCDYFTMDSEDWLKKWKDILMAFTKVD